MTKSADPDQTPRSVASGKGLHCLQRPSVRMLRLNMILKIILAGTKRTDQT